MRERIKVIELELTDPPVDIQELEGYSAVKALVLMAGTPIGCINAPVTNGKCPATRLRSAALDQFSGEILEQAVCASLARVPARPLEIETLFEAVPRSSTSPGSAPLVTIAICTHDRPVDLALCLDSISKLRYPALDILVIDNAPGSDAAERMLEANHPRVRHIIEPRPGLNWARNRAILEARGEIIAFTDDDTVVHPRWVDELVNAFAENPHVMGLSGLVMPHELETPAQILFEGYGGVSCGFTRRWIHSENVREVLNSVPGARLGTGANMAFRRAVFDRIGGFDPALDAGTETSGGGDLEIFHRLIKEGFTFLYEPRVIVRHRHRRNYAQLRSQIFNQGRGFCSFLVRTSAAYREDRKTLVRLGFHWLWRWNLRRCLISLFRPWVIPRGLVLAELHGCLSGLGSYRRARSLAAKMAHGIDHPALPSAPRRDGTTAAGAGIEIMAVRTLDLAQPLRPVSDVADYSHVRIHVMRQNEVLGKLDLANGYQPVSQSQIAGELARALTFEVIPFPSGSPASRRACALAAMTKRFLPSNPRSADEPESLPADVAVSIVVATKNNLTGLHRCLNALLSQNTSRKLEILVVDNDPESGETNGLDADFPKVQVLPESRPGLSYALNAGIMASTGEIIALVSDDVVPPPDWIERLTAPFARPDVQGVTGRILAQEKTQTLWPGLESDGADSATCSQAQVDGNWFRNFWRQAVPVWQLGSISNAAFRASVFSHPQIGLIEESLGPGTPTGAGAGQYLLYQILQQGGTIVHDPAAFVWGRDITECAGLLQKRYAACKGHMAFQLLTLFCDHDWRALIRLAFELPAHHLRQILPRRGKSKVYWELEWASLKGLLAGPAALWISCRRMRREGRSGVYVPVAQRKNTTWRRPAVREATRRPQPASPVAAVAPR